MIENEFIADAETMNGIETMHGLRGFNVRKFAVIKTRTVIDLFMWPSPDVNGSVGLYDSDGCIYMSDEESKSIIRNDYLVRSKKGKDNWESEFSIGKLFRSRPLATNYLIDKKQKEIDKLQKNIDKLKNEIDVEMKKIDKLKKTL